MSRGLPLGFGGFIPAVLAHTPCGPTVTWCGVAWRIPPWRGGSSRCVAWSWIPHASTGRGPWGLASFWAAWGFIPSAVHRSVCWCMARSLQGTENNVKCLNPLEQTSLAQVTHLRSGVSLVPAGHLLGRGIRGGLISCLVPATLSFRSSLGGR